MNSSEQTLRYACDGELLTPVPQPDVHARRLSLPLQAAIGALSAN